MTKLGIGTDLSTIRGRPTPINPLLQVGRVQSKAIDVSLSITLDSTPVQGNTVVLVAMAPVNDAGWTWPAGYLVRQTAVNGQGWYVGFADKVAGASEPALLTMGGTFAVTNASLYAVELTRTTGYDTHDPSNSTSGTVSLAHGPATPALANSFGICVTYVTGTGGTGEAATNGFVPELVNTVRCKAFTKQIAAAAAESTTVTWTNSRSNAGFLAIYKPIP
jgi:hypothetical protein